ncbi:hypothetical protein [Hugenholtzia roseola]|uniref:hypothetical protein n=1 Tax=Hugenholtzia roseola TaxID=1002 RepID=UPI0003F85C4C|nr:hypothetical protein [Hugenholtzia roseola]
MAKTSTPKQHNVPTTNFVINLDKINISALQEKYQLFTLEVPDSFRFSQDKNKFAKLHNTYKEQLNLPYYFYSFAQPKACIFVLVDKSEKPEKRISLTFDFLKGEKVTAQEKNIIDLCTQSNLHILAKLFLSSWYYKAHRTCQGDYFYIHSKDDKQKTTALLAKIQESKGEFQITSEASYLKKLDSKFDIKYINFYNYFEQIQGTRYLRQLKQSEVGQRLKNNQNLNTIFRDTTTQDAKNLNFKPRRPAIKWYDSHKTDTNAFQGCRSELLRNFQSELVAYYNEVFGERVAEKRSHFMTQVIPMEQMGKQSKKVGSVKGYGFNEKTGEGTGLYLKLLGEIGVLDLRQKDVPKPNQNNFQDYIDLLNKYFGNLYEISFSEIKREDLESSTKPILVLQDVEKQLFEEDGFLLGYDDHKREIYQAFASKIPMQTLNINLNKADDFNSADVYFEYDIFKFEDYKYRLDVCLNELLLKKYIVDKLPINGTFDKGRRNSLPLVYSFETSKNTSLVSFAYMYQNTFMYVDNHYVLQFLNLDNPSEKQKRNEFLKNWGIDWFQFEKQFADRNYTRNENGQNKTYQKNGETKDKHEENLKQTHFVFAKDLVLAIEETEERVLFDTSATQKTESQRIIESKTALEGIYFSETENIYTVGEKSMGMSMDKSIKIRRLHYYQKPANFKIDDLLQTLSVQFVRNKQYTVYPYFFDLLRLYQKDIRQE